jgi:S1-C subfamily serine protease
VIRRVLDDLEKHGAIRYSYMGVVLGEAANAVQITSVIPESPAAAAGLETGQRIAAIDGLACPSTALFSRVLAHHRPGEEVILRLCEDGREIRVRLGERAAARAGIVNAGMIGLSCVDLGPELRRFLGLPDATRGVAVQEVEAGSAAEAAGFRRGDVITRGGDGDVVDLEELNAALAGARGTIALLGVRGDDRMGWTVTLPEPKGK